MHESSMPRALSRWIAVVGVAAVALGSATAAEAAASAAAAAAAATAPVEKPKPKPKPRPKPKKPRVMVNSGFTPATRGFGFENYGDKDPKGQKVQNLTAAQMRRTFGDTVCAYLSGDTCELTPSAQAWMDDVNDSMSGGHCYGMSVASLLLWKKRLDPNAFGAPTTPRLDLTGNTGLQEQIAYNWAFQKSPLVRRATFAGTPNQILAKLIKELRSGNTETWTLAFFLRKGGGGHAVTPYQVRDMGNGQWQVLIYDNNFPGKVRAIKFDRKRNSWSYYATTIPNVPTAKYDGDAKTRSLMLMPTNPGLKQQPSPFNSRKSHNQRNDEPEPVEAHVYLEGHDADHAHLLITDGKGHYTGYFNGERVNTIPGARIEDELTDGLGDNPEPDYYIPAGVDFKITVDGAGLKEEDDTTAVGVIGDGYEYRVRDIDLKPGDQQVIDASENGTKLAYSTDTAQHPTLELGAQYPEDFYTFSVKADIKGPGTTTLELPLEGDTFSVGQSKPGSEASYTVTTERDSDQGVKTFKHQTFTLRPCDTAKLDFAAWEEGGEMPEFDISNT
jgi:hypothetical protein